MLAAGLLAFGILWVVFKIGERIWRVYVPLVFPMTEGAVAAALLLALRASSVLSPPMVNTGAGAAV